jgi:hypothetical protein
MADFNFSVFTQLREGSSRLWMVDSLLERSRS